MGDPARQGSQKTGLGQMLQVFWDPKDQTNISILQSGSEVPNKEDVKNHGCRILVLWASGLGLVQRPSMV